jgi:hypothetical protein
MLLRAGVRAQAVADYFGVRMMVVTSYPEGELIEITPRGPLLTKRALYLSFWAEVCATLLSVGLSFRHCGVCQVYQCHLIAICST